MSYIVPRNKPDRCTNCTFMDKITYDCKLMYGNDYPDFEAQYNNCPLIELPPHGRLIDADELKSKFRHGNGDDDADSAWISTIRRFITQADTIIEAEGTE